MRDPLCDWLGENDAFLGDRCSVLDDPKTFSA
jgi:hypothetical protein